MLYLLAGVLNNIVCLCMYAFVCRRQIFPVTSKQSIAKALCASQLSVQSTQFIHETLISCLHFIS